MIGPARLAWLQLRQQPLRLTVAISGVAFAVILVSVQLGFQDALLRSAVTVHSRLDGDIVLIHPQSTYLVAMKTFSRRRLYQAAGFPGVASVAPVYSHVGSWRNPFTSAEREIFVIGVDPVDPGLRASEQPISTIRLPDRVLFDEASRAEFGPIPATFRSAHPISTYVNQRTIQVAGLFRMGTSFGVDASILTSDLNFLRLFPERDPGLIEMGVVRVSPGHEPAEVRDALAAGLPTDVAVLTREQFMQREQQYWATATPIGYVFKFGVVMGLVVGAIIVYQILFADISDHLDEYATLRAIGYGSGYLVGVVLAEATLLALAGYAPALALSGLLFRFTHEATMLPMELHPLQCALVLLLTLVMCSVSAVLAVRKARSADPAEVF